MRARLILVSSLAAAALALGCSPYDPDLGDTPFRCGTSDPKCPDGYTCDTTVPPTGVCLEEGSGPLPDASDNPDPADAGPFACNDDSMIEPNDDIGSAHVTPIPDSQTQYALATLAICPGGDVDIYRLRVDAANQDIVAKVTTTRARSEGELILEILNGTGIPSSSPATYTGDTIQDVTLANAAPGVWYVQVRGLDATVQNNYRLDIELVTGS